MPWFNDKMSRLFLAPDRVASTRLIAKPVDSMLFEPLCRGGTGYRVSDGMTFCHAGRWPVRLFSRASHNTIFLDNSKLWAVYIVLALVWDL